MSDEIKDLARQFILNREVAFEIGPEMRYNPRCYCDNTVCARHGNCVACRAFHKLTGHPPTCEHKWNPKDFR